MLIYKIIESSEGFIVFLCRNFKGEKMNAFQERLQDLLIENNLNRLQLSKIIGISSTTINGYFNNDYFPQIDIAIKMAEYFNCTLDFLFGLSEDESHITHNNKTFIENFDALLKERGLPIAKVLRELGMSEYNYYRWKDGKFPKTINLIEIAKYFDVSIDYLIGRIDA